jgi:hypothetical protein
MTVIVTIVVARIYVSSTYEDLRNERGVIWNALKKLDHDAMGMEAYAAADARPVERCVEDVASCEGYVGLIGHRYGYVPDGYGGLSVTHLEYKAASERGIPHLMFFLDRRGGPPLEPSVAEFRSAIEKEVMVRHVSDASSLEADVLHATMETFEHGRKIPPLLPYLCDRGDQMISFRSAFGVSFGPEGDRRPLLAVAHGDEHEAHSKFAERVRRHAIPELLRSNGRRATAVKPLTLPWPTPWQSVEASRGRLLGSFAAVLDEPRPDRVVARLTQFPGVSFVETHVLTEDCRRDGTTMLTSFAEFWDSLPVDVSRPMLVVMLLVKYASPRWWTPSTSRTNRAIAEALNALPGRAFQRLRCAVLPCLGVVRRNEADHWASSEEVRRVTGGEDLEPAIRKIFEQGKGEIPMEELAPKLRTLLEEQRARGRR